MSATNWLTVDEAWTRLQQAVPDSRPDVEQMPIHDSLGRVLAESPHSLINVPPADNSAMDGFAIGQAALADDTPITLPITQRIPAGTAPQPLTPSSAARIFTGSEIPPGADTVVMQENCDYDEAQVTINALPAIGNSIRQAGEDIAAHQPLLPAGHRLRPQDLGLLASAGIASVKVYRPLQVAVVVTGDELVTPGQALQAGQIYESNGPMLGALLSQMGCQVTHLQAPDDLDSTVALLRQAAQSDAIISVGGVSVGEEDHVKTALNQLGQTAFWKIGLKPGKPFVLGHLRDNDGLEKPLLGLPGNPVSAFVTFALFCRPFLNTLQGGVFQRPRHWWAKTGFAINKANARQQYLRARLAVDDNGEVIVQRNRSQSSAVQTSLCEADVLAVIPAETTLAAGDMIQVISLVELINT